MTLSELIGDISTPLKTVADAYVNIYNSKFQAGLAKQQNTIEELKATTSLLQQQNEAERLAQANAKNTSSSLIGFDFTNNEWVKWAALGVGAFMLYKWAK